MTPRVAIVVPVHRQPALACEAIRTAFDQKGGPDHVVIAVDDGCPQDETRAALEGWALLEPARFHRLHQPNRGLSGARNSGIRFALDRYPSIEAVFLLDADNRLDGHALALFAELLDRHPGPDWFYPNFDMIGLSGNAHAGGDFSLPLLAESNFCEAGSLVRRRVFEAGIWFDETMRAGYEDWEFWLRAAGAGFRGQPVRQSFFRYRKRPESMLSGSHDVDRTLRAAIRARHRWLHDRDGVARRSAGSLPRYRLLETGEDGAILAFTDPDAPAEQPFEAALAELMAARARPGQSPRPVAWCFARPGVLAALSERRLARSVIWHLHASLAGADIAAARLSRHPKDQRHLRAMPPAPPAGDRPGERLDTRRTRALAEARFRADLSAEAEALEEADILMIATDRLETLAFPKARKEERARRQAEAALEGLRVARLSVELETPPAREGTAPLAAMKDFAARIRGAAGDTRYLLELAPWRDDPQVSGPAQLDWVLRNATLGSAPLPLNPASEGRDIGFVVPIFLFGGVEKCVVALAEALRARGQRCHLFVYGDGAMAGTPWMCAPFETIHQLSDPVLRDWKGPQYLGTNLASRPTDAFLSDMLAPLASMDAVVMTGSAATFHGLGALRAKGVATVSWEHLIETGGYGRSYGTPYLATAYEGALDLILTCSHRLADWLHGQGVPREKLLPIPNGPGFPLAPDAVRAAREERATRAHDAPLRVGFLGRLDAQKGADRFLELAHRCRALPVEFSITGSAILGQSALAVPDWIRRYPAAFSIEELAEAFARIDVLAMPSRDEGLPLTIMEAQREGVIPLATDVGAVSEAIAHDRTGLLVEGPDVVGEMAGWIARLAADPALRARLAAGTGPAAGARQWEANAGALMAALEALFARRRAA